MYVYLLVDTNTEDFVFAVMRYGVQICCYLCGIMKLVLALRHQRIVCVLVVLCVYGQCSV